MTERTESAYHEAGHAVELYALGFDLGDASIVASEEHLGLMGTPIDQDLVDRLAVMRNLAEDREKFIVRQMAVAFAGVRTVEIFTEREHDPQSSDMQTWLPGSDESRLKLWLPLADEDPEEQPLFYDRAWNEAKRVLQENWGAVQALAEALLEHEELDAAAVRSVLEEAGCARDYAPVRRVFLEVEGERLREQSSKLRTQGDPENQMEGLQERIARTDNELDALRQEES